MSNVEKGALAAALSRMKQINTELATAKQRVSDLAQVLIGPEAPVDHRNETGGLGHAPDGLAHQMHGEMTVAEKQLDELRVQIARLEKL